MGKFILTDTEWVGCPTEAPTTKLEVIDSGYIRLTTSNLPIPFNVKPSLLKEE